LSNGQALTTPPATALTPGLTPEQLASMSEMSPSSTLTWVTKADKEAKEAAGGSGEKLAPGVQTLQVRKMSFVAPAPETTAPGSATIKKKPTPPAPPARTIARPGDPSASGTFGTSTGGSQTTSWPHGSVETNLATASSEEVSRISSTELPSVPTGAVQIFSPDSDDDTTGEFPFSPPSSSGNIARPTMAPSGEVPASERTLNGRRLIKIATQEIPLLKPDDEPIAGGYDAAVTVDAPPPAPKDGPPVQGPRMLSKTSGIRPSIIPPTPSIEASEATIDMPPDGVLGPAMPNAATKSVQPAIDSDKSPFDSLIKEANRQLADVDLNQRPPGLPPTGGHTVVNDDQVATAETLDHPLQGAAVVKHPSRRMPIPTQAPDADFVLGSLLGKGGQGEVWRATQTSLSREVAVKRFIGKDVEEFLREAYTSAELDHPNIVPIYDLGRVMDVDGEKPLLAMKMVRGTPWHESMRKDRVQEEFNLDAFLARHLPILLDVTNAVSYAHSKGIIHRDLKPHQVMVGAFGETFLMDWGLALSVDEDVPIVIHEGMPKFHTLRTATNQCGSPAYMAPEQTQPSTAFLGFHTDIYLLGAILFELVVGKPPHASDSAQGAYFMAMCNEVVEVQPTAPPELVDIMRKALASDPAERYKTAAEFKKAIEEYQGGAGKRRESKALVEEAGAKAVNASGDYRVLTECISAIARARGLWAENPTLAQTEDVILDIFARAGIENDDLKLARVQAERISDELARVPLMNEIEMREKRNKALSVQRRQATVAVVVLLIMMVGGIFYLFQVFKRQSALLDQAQQLQDMNLEQATMNTLIERIRTLEESERSTGEEGLRELANTNQALGFRELTHKDPAKMDRLQRLLATTRSLVRDREAMTANIFAVGKLSPPPVEILLTEAYVLLAIDRSQEGIERAFDLFKLVSERRPDLQDPPKGMMAASDILGELAP